MLFHAPLIVLAHHLDCLVDSLPIEPGLHPEVDRGARPHGQVLLPCGQPQRVAHITIRIALSYCAQYRVIYHEWLHRDSLSACSCTSDSSASLACRAASLRGPGCSASSGAFSV